MSTHPEQAQVEAMLKLSLAVENARIDWYGDTSVETLLRLKQAREALRSALVAALTPQAPAEQPEAAERCEHGLRWETRCDGCEAAEPVPAPVQPATAEVAHQRVLMDAFRSDLAALLDRCCSSSNWYRVCASDGDEMVVHADVLRALAADREKQP